MFPACLRFLLCWTLLLAATTASASEIAAVSPLLPAGGHSEGSLDSGQSRTHRLDAEKGAFVQGSLEGTGKRLILRDASGEALRVLAHGRGERQDFMFVVGDHPPYALEVQAVEPGEYRLRIAQVVPLADQVAPPPASIESPILRAMTERLTEGGDSSSFWRNIESLGTPLVEAEGVEPPLAEDQLLVTFLWRGAEHSVRLFGAPTGEHDGLHRLGRSDIWYRSYRLPRDTRLGYRLAPDVPELNAPATQRRRAILATAQRDPFNRHSFPADPVDRFHGSSVLELPGAPAQPWIAPRPDVPAGQVETLRFASNILGNSRDIHLYRPPGWQPGAPGNALLVAFDGERYVEEVPTPVILDNLIAAGRLPPTAAILIGNPSNAARSAELPPNPAFLRFLAEELMPWAREQGLSAEAGRTVIAGSSYGGLAAAHAGFHHPEWFGNVYSQSGSFWWAPDAVGEEGEPEWLTRQFAAAPKKPVRFYLEAGLFETRGMRGGILEATRHLRNVLRAKGYDVQHREYASGHDYLHWRGTLATGLTALLGPPPAH
ncbi:enterochelin esterase [Telmatospirillum sp. J64-1]|uniref:enterochelin esterase n=1 Tax=Telmatospirillum sp. J64-1 TaxID=2502183 RepID=UPI00115F234E|nr:enterochelin esterase [Telmatospirillum sp. J64-1]